MKCLIYSNPADTVWIADYFSEVNPYFLKYLNKPLLEYFLDFCVLVGIREVRVIINESGSELEGYFGNGRQWGVELSYGFAKPEDKIKDILSKNRRFCQGDLFLIDGYQFIMYSKQSKEYSFFEGASFHSIKDDGCALYYLPGIKDIMSIDLQSIFPDVYQELASKRIYSIRSFYDLNILLISTFRHNYFLPGYNNEDGVYLGKNIIDHKNTLYSKPLVLGDNVQIKFNSQIGPNVVLGNSVIIDHSTSIKDSIIFDHCYIGSDMEIDKKIVYRKFIIDPISEEVIEIVDNFLVSDIYRNLLDNSLKKVFFQAIAFLLILISTLPFLFFIFLCALAGMKISKGRFLLNFTGESDDFYCFVLPGYNVFKRFFYRFSLDLYPFYFKVLNGRLDLVGNHLLPQNANSIKILRQLPLYLPGIYDYPGSMLHNQNHDNFINDELEYIHNSSLFFNLKIMFNSWVTRLFSDWHSISQYLDC